MAMIVQASDTCGPTCGDFDDPSLRGDIVALIRGGQTGSGGIRFRNNNLESSEDDHVPFHVIVFGLYQFPTSFMNLPPPS